MLQQAFIQDYGRLCALNRILQDSHLAQDAVQEKLAAAEPCPT